MTAGWRIPFTIIAIPTLVCAGLGAIVAIRSPHTAKGWTCLDLKQRLKLE